LELPIKNETLLNNSIIETKKRYQKQQETQSDLFSLRVNDRVNKA